MNESSWTFQAIGRVRSPLKEKFGLPRQSGLVPAIKGEIEILPPYNREEAFAQLRGYSHIWVISVFHLAMRKQWQATVRPPRLGGNVRVGVFASRSPYRPNPIGLSLCALRGIERSHGRLRLLISGCDLVDATPVLDIKPYLPYSDVVDAAQAGFTELVQRDLLTVTWSGHAQQQVQQAATAQPELAELIEALIAQDPRPAYQHADAVQEYGMRLYDFNIRFSVTGQAATILSVEMV